MIGDSSGSYTRAQASYHDFQGLRDLQRGAIENDPEALREVARQFEALFIQMILQSSREANETLAGDNRLLHSQEMGFFEGMLDEQFSLAISQGGNGEGLGLAQMLVNQLSRERPEPGEPVPDHVRRNAQQLSDELVQQLADRRLNFTQVRAPLAEAANPEQTPAAIAAQREASERTAQALQAGRRPPYAAASESVGRQPLEISGLPVREDKRTYFASPEDFVRHLYPIAEQAAARLGVDPRFMLAQSALETGWGRHMIARADGSNSFNLFGIKADRRWSGEAAEVPTLEYRNGRPQQERWAFRAYDSFEQSMEDYVDFLLANPRYQSALEQTDNPRAFARGLQQAGYATDPRYAYKIVNIMEGSTLNQALERLEQDSAAPISPRPAD
ncbi:flagellar assembly peptidoglycan hydrolase FlgJ [Marinospirillum sp.]|uniref:flagellar assembly peptidoglycan hydrolase FlgJ n=1 Tax=Marinospirillum sp. TaxID=2183934 RepID=UPI003A8BEAF5